MTNSLRAVKCLECGERLPWADEAEKALAARPAASAAPPVSRPTPRAADDEGDEDAWWKTLGAGLILLALSGYLFWYFSSWEASGGLRRMRWWLALAYSLGGKWPIVVIVALLGVVGVCLGVMEMLKRKR